MKDLEQIFFELIRVAIGTQSCLTRTPSASEWKKAYVMAKKQSLVGVCFAGVQRLRKADEANGTHVTVNLPEMGYVKWMGMAAKIQRKNEKVNKQCVELQDMLAADGLRSCILKGQGVGALYRVSGERSLSDLRQSGDIDVWVFPNEGESVDAHIERVVRYAKEFSSQSHFSGKHIDLSVFEDTDVELHVTPAKMNNPWHNRRLQKWLKEQINSERLEVNGFCIPSIEFNLVYLLLHCYDHLLFEGVGLRQMMDYYFVLNTNRTKFTNVGLLKQLGLYDFAGAVMWVMKEVFGIDEQYMICEANEKEGRFLLDEIMSGGNFGQYGNDGVMEGHNKGNLAFFMARMKRNWRFLVHYPSEIVWNPYAMLSYYFWKKSMINKL